MDGLAEHWMLNDIFQRKRVQLRKIIVVKTLFEDVAIDSFES
jgi:hypothetical protein